ncbi:hypothetical protein, partial [Salmonella sp. s55044]|uniref:hypothetical protein n=1 Tax=Salmonella sp. s55044 TaxID=3159677 RepID=UPI0039809A68
MNKLVFLAVITAAIGSSIPGHIESPPPKPCDTPSQWEGRASEWDHITESNNRFKISFDGVGLRKRVLEEKKSFMPGKRFYEYIMEYETNTMYTINLNYDTCTTSTLSQP